MKILMHLKILKGQDNIYGMFVIKTFQVLWYFLFVFVHLSNIHDSDKYFLSFFGRESTLLFTFSYFLLLPLNICSVVHFVRLSIHDFLLTSILGCCVYLHIRLIICTKIFQNLFLKFYLIF